MTRQSSILGGNSGFGLLPLRYAEYFFTDTQIAAGLYQKYNNAVRGYLNNGDVIALVDDPANGVVYVDATDTEVWTTSISAGELDGNAYVGFWLNDAADKFYIVTNDANDLHFAYVAIDGTVTKVGSVLGFGGMSWNIVAQTANSSAVHPIYGTSNCVVCRQDTAQNGDSSTLIINYETLAVVNPHTLTPAIGTLITASMPPDKNGYMLCSGYPSAGFAVNNLVKVSPEVGGLYRTSMHTESEDPVGAFTYQVKYVYMAGEIWQVDEGVLGLSETQLAKSHRVQTLDGVTTINAQYLATFNIPT